MGVDWFIRNLSKIVYHNAEEEIGSENMIKTRRLLDRICSVINDRCRNCPHDHLLSGSRAEGFRFQSSDTDTMIVHNDIEIRMENISAFHDDNINYDLLENVLMMETDLTRPGFCLLRVFGGSYDVLIYLSSVPYHNGHYMSSALWRTEVQKYISESIEHGPCESGFIHGCDYDIAHCLKCLKWPKSANSCINRLVLRGWISIDVLVDIVGKGSHLVPIGDKTSDKEMLEWRISFSEAEKMLIHNMNHCQFLCYGLLKVFFKEVINSRAEISGLLCSYFLKTSVFWEISYGNAPWDKKDFLKRVWDCFRRLISWVKNGYCPNFFIPENNMFEGKIYGRSQELLLRHLVTLYSKGYRCVPLCTYDSSITIPNFLYFDEQVFDYNNFMKMKSREDIEIILRIVNSLTCIGQKNTFKLCGILECLQQMHSRNGSFIFLKIIEILKKYTIQCLFSCFMLNPSPCRRSTSNKKGYKMIKGFIKVMNQNKFDVCNHKLLTAVILHNLGMHHHVIKIITEVVNRLNHEKDTYSLLVRMTVEDARKPFDVIMREFFVSNVILGVNLALPELLYEHKNPWNRLMIYPPFVLIDLLLFLSYFRLSMFAESEFVLQDLTLLLNNDNDDLISDTFRALSWQVLGICQEMSGYSSEACTSYFKALADPYGNHLREATLARIRNLVSFQNDFNGH